MRQNWRNREVVCIQIDVLQIQTVNDAGRVNIFLKIIIFLHVLHSLSIRRQIQEALFFICFLNLPHERIWRLRVGSNLGSARINTVATQRGWSIRTESPAPKPRKKILLQKYYIFENLPLVFSRRCPRLCRDFDHPTHYSDSDKGMR